MSVFFHFTAQGLSVYQREGLASAVPMVTEYVARIPHTSAWQSRDRRNRCRDVLWLSWPAPNNPFPRGHNYLQPSLAKGWPSLQICELWYIGNNTNIILMISYWNYMGIGKPIQFTIGKYLSVEWNSHPDGLELVSDIYFKEPWSLHDGWWQLLLIIEEPSCHRLDNFVPHLWVINLCHNHGLDLVHFVVRMKLRWPSLVRCIKIVLSSWCATFCPVTIWGVLMIGCPCKQGFVSTWRLPAEDT